MVSSIVTLLDRWRRGVAADAGALCWLCPCSEAVGSAREAATNVVAAAAAAAAWRCPLPSDLALARTGLGTDVAAAAACDCCSVDVCHEAASDAAGWYANSADDGGVDTAPLR